VIFVTLEIPFHEKRIYGYTDVLPESEKRLGDVDGTIVCLSVFTHLSRERRHSIFPPLGHTHDESLCTYDSACYMHRVITRTPPLNGGFRQIHGLSKMQILQLTN